MKFVTFQTAGRTDAAWIKNFMKLPKYVDPANIAKANSEHAHQVAVFCWMAQHYDKYPELRMAFAIPNGGERNIIVASRLKAEGVRPHIPDIFLPIPRGKWHGLFIEMKKPGGRVDPGQLEYLQQLRRLGYGACVCVGWLVATEALVSYLEWRETCNLSHPLSQD